MHEPQQHSPQTGEEPQQGIDVRAAYKVLVRAFYRLETNTTDNKEKDHD